MWHTFRIIYQSVLTLFAYMFSLLKLGKVILANRRGAFDITELVKISYHAELQKLGKDLREKEEEVEGALNCIDVQIDSGATLGIELSARENRALFAIQQLLYLNDFKSSEGCKSITCDGDNGFWYSGDIPVIRFTPIEYYKTYGLAVKQNSRGENTLSGREQEDAIAALEALATRSFTFVYKKMQVHKNGEKRYVAIQTTSPLVKELKKYYVDFNHADVSNLANGIVDCFSRITKRLKWIQVEPAEILLDQLDSWYLLKPASFYQDIRNLQGRKMSKYVDRFLEYILIQGRTVKGKQGQNSNGRDAEMWTSKIGLKKLAGRLRMDSFIKAGQYKRVEEEITKCASIAVQLDYLKSFELVPGKKDINVKLLINAAMFNGLVTENT